MFKSVSPKVDFPKLEREILKKWYEKGIVKKYLTKNNSSTKKFSFLDGPITANNPMGVHHAWGRTYKDLWQRFFNMRGYKQRFQNGFDEQGLWVEVEVEKELGLKNKKDIENLIPGDRFKSLEKFINLCKERVKKYSNIQTEQSKRLGYFMDWDNSYHTSSDENNYAIWNFIKVINEKGWLYKGRDSVPWCPRCGTAISQHEILTEEYKEIAHDSIFIEYPIIGRKNEFLIAWTTTPWTLLANVALAIHRDYDYVIATGTEKGNKYYLLKESAEKLKLNIEKVIKGQELVGLNYVSPFDDLTRVKESLAGYEHEVIATDELILPISKEEGTGIVHTATGAGSEDFQLGKKYKLPVIEIIDEEANYLDGLGDFSKKNGKYQPELIIDFLKKFEDGKYLFLTKKYTHRYPTCWRCKTELVWRVVDEWYIAMDKPSNSKLKTQNSKPEGKTFREMMVEVAKKINWIPKWGLERELDWLKNMHDWLISKKRYWGLALPIWECQKCGKFTVIGGYDELKKKTVDGWSIFQGNSPHRPWIDEIKIKCESCGETASRIPDVGNPWLDAGIVPFSTLNKDWFPADFITESFPGQFKNWFYSLIAMSTVLKNTNPFRTVLGFASVRDEKGEEMHKSKGNAIEFNVAADDIGVDVMRWLYLRTNPEHNVNFGYKTAEEIRRFFHLILWNVFTFFINYAEIDNWLPSKNKFTPVNLLDRWILSRLNGNIKNITESLEEYNAYDAAGNAEIFIINDLSRWYVRRSRDRIGPAAENNDDKNDTYQTLWIILTSYSKVLAPFIPFTADEIYVNLTGEESVHLADWPEVDMSLYDDSLEKEMQNGILLSSSIHAFRKEANIRVRIPFKKLDYKGPFELTEEIKNVVLSEVNVYDLVYKGKNKEYIVSGETDQSNQDLIMGGARDIIRKIQEERKNLGTKLNEKVDVVLEDWSKEHEDYIKRKTLIRVLVKGEEFKVVRV